MSSHDSIPAHRSGFEQTGIPVATLRWWRHIGEGSPSFRLGRKNVVSPPRRAATMDRPPPEAHHQRRKARERIKVLQPSRLYLMTFKVIEAQIYEATLPLWARVHALALARSELNLHTG
jgi:hypothetical protein